MAQAAAIQPDDVMLPQPVPRLRVVADSDVAPLVERAFGDRLERTLVVSDRHNISSFRGMRPTLAGLKLVAQPDFDAFKATRLDGCEVVVGVGGCSALDFARACAGFSRTLVVFPTILSTSCIASAQSVLYQEGVPRHIHARPPAEVIVCLREVAKGKPHVVRKWTASGLADLWSDISGAIDAQFVQDSFDLPALRRSADVAFQVLNWVLDSDRAPGRTFDEQQLERVATFLHKGSLVGGPGAAGEHDLYYSMMRRQSYKRSNPTHGELVTIGTLLTVRRFCRLVGNHELFKQLREAFEKVGLPTEYADLNRIHVDRKHVLDGLLGIHAKRTFLSGCTWTPDRAARLLDDTYKSKAARPRVRS